MRTVFELMNVLLEQMLRSLRLINFKSFEDAELSIGGLTVIVGVNASGKSNIRDALRFLHGVGRGYSLADIIGGKYGEGGYREWSPLRGATKEIIRFGQNSFKLALNVETHAAERLVYEIEVSRDTSRGTFGIVSERLTTPDQSWKAPIFDKIDKSEDQDELDFRLRAPEGSRGQGKRQRLRRDRPALTQLQHKTGVPSLHRKIIENLVAVLSDIRFLDLAPDAMRQPSFPGQTVLGEGGENLPTVLQETCTSEERKKTLIAWISELTPLEVVDFEFDSDSTGRILMFIVDTDGNRTSALSASDGTLRFLAMAVALMGVRATGLLFFEEIDNGLHPSRMRLLTELIERQVEITKVQVVTTTHSPDLLTIVGDKTFQSTSVVYRSPQSTTSIIRLVPSLPHAVKLRLEQSLGRLHVSGWFEDALFFGEASEAAE